MGEGPGVRGFLAPQDRLEEVAAVLVRVCHRGLDGLDVGLGEAARHHGQVLMHERGHGEGHLAFE